MLESTDGHSAWVNRRALELAGVTRATPDPPRGRIERDAAGEPTGALHEAAKAWSATLAPSRPGRVGGRRRARPGPPAPPRDHRLAGRRRGAADAGRLPGGGGRAGPAHRPGRGRPALGRRGRRGPAGRPGRAPPGWGGSAGCGPARPRSSPTGSSRTPPPPCSTPTWTATATPPATGHRHARGRRAGPGGHRPDAEAFDVHVHAIGDRAVRDTLDAFEAAAAANGRRDARHQIAHLQFVHPDDRPRFRRLGVVANAQPFWSCSTAPCAS